MCTLWGRSCSPGHGVRLCFQATVGGEEEAGKSDAGHHEAVGDLCKGSRNYVCKYAVPFNLWFSLSSDFIGQKNIRYK